MGNYPIFTVILAIYHYAERIWRFIVTPNFLYNIYDHEKYYPGEPVNIHIRLRMNVVLVEYGTLAQMFHLKICLFQSITDIFFGWNGVK